MASIDQHKTLFLLTPNLIGFVSKSRHAVEQYPKKNLGLCYVLDGWSIYPA